MGTDDLSNSAAEFSNSLRQLAVTIDADIGKVIRTGVLKVFGNIIKRSPVKTGAYRGSHGISNMDPSPTEKVIKGKKGDSYSPANAEGWMWRVGDGDIWLFNNVPYAERLENGWSKQAPGGVYQLALAEITVFLNVELSKSQTLEPMGGE